jgi:hypothetical protein
MLIPGILHGENVHPGWIYKNYDTLTVYTDPSGNSGFKDKSGKVIIPACYQKIGSFLNKKMGNEFREIPFQSGITRKEFPATFSYENRVQRMYINADHPVVPVKAGDKWRLMYIQHDNFIVIKGVFPGGLIPCSSDTPKKKFGYINPFGQWVIPPAYDLALQFSEGLALVMIEEMKSDYGGRYRRIKKYGYINIKGEMAIPLREFASLPFPFVEGRARVEVEIPEQSGKGPHRREYYGYIDEKGTMVTEPRYEEAENFHRGIARAMYHDYRLYNLVSPVNECLGGCAMVLSGRIGGSPVFDIETPMVFCVIDRSGRVLFTTKEGWDPVDHYINRHYPGWFDQ